MPCGLSPARPANSSWLRPAASRCCLSSKPKGEDGPALMDTSSLVGGNEGLMSLCIASQSQYRHTSYLMAFVYTPLP